MSQRRKMFDVQHPFFVPLYRRITVVGVALVWAGAELWLGNPLWAALFAICGLYCAHQFFIAFDPPATKEEELP